MFKEGGLNDATDQLYSYTFFQRILKFQEKRLTLTEMVEWKLQECNLQNYSILQIYCL